jgi:hypothetical protein
LAVVLAAHAHSLASSHLLSPYSGTLGLFIVHTTQISDKDVLAVAVRGVMRDAFMIQIAGNRIVG